MYERSDYEKDEHENMSRRSEAGFRRAGEPVRRHGCENLNRCPGGGRAEPDRHRPERQVGAGDAAGLKETVLDPCRCEDLRNDHM